MACCNSGPIQTETCKQLPCMSLEKRTGMTFAFTYISTYVPQRQGSRQDPHFTDAHYGLPRAHGALRPPLSQPPTTCTTQGCFLTITFWDTA